MDPHTVSDAWQESVASGIKMIKVVQDMEWAKRLDESVAEAKAAKDKEWANRLESAVAEAEIAKDKVWETVDQFKETSHSNEIQDLKEDHAHEIKEIEERHAETLQELATKHDEEVQQLIRKHGAEARRLDMRRAQGAKEVKKLKEDFAEIEAENKATKKSLIHMTGQRDALFKAFVDMKGQSSPQVIPPLEPSQSEHFHNHLHGQVESIHDTANRQFRPVINTKVSAADETESPASDRSTPQPHQQGQQSQAPIVPNALYPRLQFLESENAQLRADLDQRHEDVRYAVGKADKLRGLLQDDPAKAETYPVILIHQELIEDLQTRLEESHKATERERLEAQRLRDRIDIVTADMQSETLGRELALKDKEAAWEQNETLLKHLKGRFTKSDFDNAFWTQYESLAKEKEHSEGEIAGYKREHRNLMEEAVDRRTKIAELELGAQHTNDDGGEHGLLDLKNEILVLQIANDALKAERAFQLAEQDNRAVGQQMPKSLRDARDRVPEGKSREIARLEAGLEGWEVVDQGRKRDVEGGEGLDACADTPKSDYGFF